MSLPNLTGPDDTQLAISLIMLASGYFGTSLFATEFDFYVFGDDKFRISHAITYLGFLLEGPRTFYTVLQDILKAKDTEHFKSRYEPQLFL